MKNKIIININRILIITIFLTIINIFNTNTIVAYNQNYLSSKKEKFIELMADAAVEDMKTTGVYASVTLGQAVIESGWGDNEIATLYNNYFGMKTGSKIYINGKETECNSSNYKQIGYAKTENQFWDGKAVCLKASEGGYAWWRVYNSPLESIQDHSRNFWCISDGRYIKNGVFESPDPQTQLYAIAKSGYAVDASGNISTINGKTYDEHIFSQIIEPNNFTKYDEGYEKIKPDYANSCSTASYEGSPLSSVKKNEVTEFKTTYDGDITQGYIYKKLLEEAEKSDKYKADEIDDRINNIINEIFEMAGSYSKGKAGSSAYKADVTYLNGTFKNQIRYYNQNDYVDYAYGAFGTIKSHGCGPTSMSIVISSFRQENIDPVTTTNWACHNGYCSISGSYHTLICALAKEYGLDCSQVTDDQVIVDSLASGNSLVVALASPGIFTTGGHFLVLTGIKNGQVSIADPASTIRTQNTYSYDTLKDPLLGHLVKFWVISG